MNNNELINELKEDEKKDFDILATFLLTQGGSASISAENFAKLLSDKRNKHSQNQNSYFISTATAERRLKTFQSKGIIDIKKNGRGRVPSSIILKSYVYKGPLITGVVPLDCPLYVKRNADDLCKEALQRGNNSDESLPFIRIKAAKGMGKSSLMIRLRDFLEKKQKQIIGYVDLGSSVFDASSFTDLDKIFYTLTEEITQAFTNAMPGLNPPPLQNFWKKERTSSKNCEYYLEELIFKKIKQPKTLFIDGIDRVLGKNIQTEFLSVLRTWNETKLKKIVNKAPIVWPSIVIACSTDPYPDHKLKGSPMQNVGIDVELQEFTRDSILELSKLYGLIWSFDEVDSLMKLIGGHPTLINRALYKLCKTDMTLAELEQQSNQVNGPFGDYLLKYLELLQKDEQLKTCFKTILKGEECNDEFVKFQLEKVGLIRLYHTDIQVSCELYRRYFQANI
jgi:hypothetical protein